MSDAVKFFRGIKENTKQEINVARIARITKIHLNGSIDAVAGNDLLINMPRLTGTYQVGNNVLVVFLDDNGQHGLSNGVVIGVVQ